MENIIGKIKQIEKLVCEKFEDLEIDDPQKKAHTMNICMLMEQPMNR